MIAVAAAARVGNASGSCLGYPARQGDWRKRWTFTLDDAGLVVSAEPAAD